MEYFVGILCIWLIAFAPLGLALHAAVLGDAGRVQAATLAPITGLAVGIVLLGGFDLLGLAPGSITVSIITLLMSAACMGVVWKRGGSWRSRSLIGAAVYTLIVITAVQIPAFDAPTSGPLGQTQSAATLQQIATIDVLADIDGASEPAVTRTAGAYEDRFLGFERLAAYTVGLGADASSSSNTWTAYTLHSVITGLLASLLVLPVLILARWRRVGFIGTLAVIGLGVLSPMMMVALGLARGELIAAVPFMVAALAAVMLARRDRGWWAVTAINAGAGLSIVGIPAVIPALGAGAVWWGMHREVPEHIAQDDAPAESRRPLIVAGVATVCSLAVAMPALVHGVLPSARAMHTVLTDALRAWPFTWIGASLDVSVPATGADRALVLLGIAVLAMVVSVAIRLRQRRELAMLAGVAVLVVTGVALSLVDRASGLVVMDLAWLCAAPIIAIATVRAVGQVRADGRDSAARKYAFFGPLLLAGLLIMFSISASITSGSRYVHGLPWSMQSGPAAPSLLTIADPWLDYLIRGDRVTGGKAVVDVDQLSQPRNRYSGASVVYERPRSLVVSSNPFSSDPPAGYTLQPEMLVASAARVFGDSGLSGSALPREHDPVEGSSRQDTGVGGIVIPEQELPDCSIQQQGSGCSADAPSVSGSCSPRDIRSARSALERSGTSERTRRVFADDEAHRPLLGVACWNVELNDDSSTLQIHMRDIGIVIPPLTADTSPIGAWTRAPDAPISPVLGGDWLRTRGSHPDARATYGNGRVRGVFDLTLESRQVADLSISLGGATGGVSAILQPGIGGWSRTIRSAVVQGDIVASNTAATKLALGRLVLRPIVHDPSCDVVLPARQGARRELVQYGTPINPIDQPQGGRAGDEVQYPGMTFTISRVDRPGPGRARVATIVAGSYLQSLGLPHYMLLDWTEQFGSLRTTPDCTGYKTKK